MNTKGTILEALDIQLLEQSVNRTVARMPVNEKTRQPFGILHGGASVVLAETVASVGALAFIDEETEYAVGLEINANHIRSVRDGMVTAVGTPLHQGRTTMVWEITITDDAGNLICVSRCTIAIRKKRPGSAIT